MTQTARVAMDPDRLMAALEPAVAGLNLRLTRDAGGASVELPGGRLTLAPEGDGCRLVLQAGDAGRLAELREAIARYAGDSGLDRLLTWQADRPAGRPDNLTLARIDRNDRLSPSFRRLRLSGDFTRFRDGGLHFRLIFGPEGADWPVSDETGMTVWPGGIDVWHRPPYTIRRIDPDCRWIDVDVVLHRGGRVSDWVERSRPGDRVALTGPGGKAPQIAPWIGYVGDETALPVIARMLERLPPETQGAARIFVPDAADRQEVAHPAGVDLQWIVHGHGLTPPDAVRGLPLPPAGRFVFFAGERQQATTVRADLAAAGLGRGEYHAANYWTDGWIPPADQVSRLVCHRDDRG